jgi:signal transduction histidine kinase
MSALLDSLLFLARADAGTEQVQLEPVDARRLCSQAFEKSRLIFQRAGITFIANLPSGSMMVMADAPYLQRLLNIVLENAAKYTPEGGRVELSLEVSAGFARFEISDTGIGIPLLDRPHIFDRFRRGANAREAHVNGSGLGLALAAWIAAHHRTQIEVESDVGGGSSFSWQLPLVPFPSLPAETAPAQTELSPLAGIR